MNSTISKIIKNNQIKVLNKQIVESNQQLDEIDLNIKNKENNLKPEGIKSKNME